MTQAEDVARSLISDNIDEIRERIIIALAVDYHNIQDSDIIRSFGEKFGGEISRRILDSDAVVEYLLEATAEDEDSLKGLMQEHLDEDLDNGTVIFDIARNVATDDAIKDIVMDSVSDMVSNYDGYDQSKFTAFLQYNTLDDLIAVLNSGNYDALYEEYQDQKE